MPLSLPDSGVNRSADLPAGRLLDVRSRYFLVTVTATYGDAVLNLQAMLDRESNWPDILWYHTP